MADLCPNIAPPMSSIKEIDLQGKTWDFDVIGLWKLVHWMVPMLVVYNGLITFAY